MPNHNKKRDELIKQINIENNNITNWETKWKIKNNINKCEVTAVGIDIKKVNESDKFKINDTKIDLKNSVTILGYKIGMHMTHHVNQILGKARLALARIRKFNAAPTKVKRCLFKAILRPILEYPNYPLTKLSKKQKGRIQTIINDGIRFIGGYRRKDKMKIKELHMKYKIDPQNIRINKLTKKLIDKMKKLYTETENNFSLYYKIDPSFKINSKPHYDKQQSMSTTIANTLFKNVYRNPRKDILHQKLKFDDTPIYKAA